MISPAPSSPKTASLLRRRSPTPPRSPGLPSGRLQHVRSPSQPSRVDRRPSQRPERKNCQCKACGTHGHEPADCNLLPRLLNCLEYRDGNPTQSKDAVSRYNARQSPAKYDKHVKRTETLARDYLNHGVPKDQIDTLVNLALASEFDDDDLPSPDAFEDHCTMLVEGLLLRRDNGRC
jgi:hypothetical protein